jgi:hypothetical protein
MMLQKIIVMTEQMHEERDAQGRNLSSKIARHHENASREWDFQPRANEGSCSQISIFASTTTSMLGS